MSEKSEKKETISQEKASNPILEILGILILAIVYVIIMYEYTKDGINIPSKSSNSSEIQKIDISFEEVLSVCPQVTLLDEERKIFDKIINDNKEIKDRMNSEDASKQYFPQDEFQIYFEDLDYKLTILQVAVENNALSVVADYEDYDLSFKVLYVNKDYFSKVVNTRNDPTKPFYLNENNQTYTKVIFP